MQSESGTTSPAAHVSSDTASATANDRLHDITSLLQRLDDSSLSTRTEIPQNPHENKLVQVRLGLASSLFMALRCKHAATAAHSLRVALGCSSWTLAMELDDERRDNIEVAALLHDVGKIGVPDHILLKPGPLTNDEVAIMNRHQLLAIDILGCCSAPTGLLDIVRYAPAWFDGSKNQSESGGIEFDLKGAELPLGARILAIVDAFDAMTTDHVYRRALSRDRALAELFDCAGKQFDSDLVRDFCHLHQQNRNDLHSQVSQRWLESLAPDLSDSKWQLNASTTEPGQAMPMTLFQQKLLDNMHDSVVFVDNQRQIFHWNQGAERLTGIASTAAYQRTWAPSLLDMRDARGNDIRDEACPVAAALRNGMQSMERLTVGGRNDQDIPIDLHAIPVVGRDGTTYGATLLLHDASNESSLEQRCQSLHSQATRDPLSGVANRAEFDRVQDLFIQAHVESKLPCSMFMCDIDHFKQVNDNYGHQAGDEIIRSVAGMLKRLSQHGDLVARYGGEEFVVLCADCNNADAAKRAEKIRRAIADQGHATLGGKSVTVSFGVTEYQPGDTPETMLRRADRALYQAKDGGRNRVVQLGAGAGQSTERRRRRFWPWRSTKPLKNNVLLRSKLAAKVPTEIAIEKLRGFIADHQAQILSTEADRIEICLSGQSLSSDRRKVDRNVSFVIDLMFSEMIVPSVNRQTGKDVMVKQTRIDVSIRTRRGRDRRKQHLVQRAREVLSSLQSYLLALEVY